MSVEVGRVHKYGGSLCIILSRRLLSQIIFRRGDQVALRVAGDKLIIQRIPLEELAKVVTQVEGADAR